MIELLSSRLPSCSPLRGYRQAIDGLGLDSTDKLVSARWQQSLEICKPHKPGRKHLFGGSAWSYTPFLQYWQTRVTGWCQVEDRKCV
jgi:hypothetical protein